MNLIELLAVMLLAVALAANGILGTSSQSYGTASERALAAALQSANAEASRSSDGVTLAITPNDRAGRSGAVAILYEGRPITGTSAGRVISTTFLPTPVTWNAHTTLGVFYSSAGRISIAPSWTAWTTMASDPGNCTNTATFTISDLTNPVTISCVDGRLL